MQRALDAVGITGGMLAHRLLTLSAQHKIGEPTALHRMAIEIAENAEAEGDWSWAERYWLVAEDLAIVAGDEEKRRDALGRVAETYVARARAIADQPYIGKATAAAHLQRAVEALRRAGGLQPRVEELQRLMMDYQRDIPASLIPMPYSVPIGDAVEEAQNAVSGKPLEEALLAFALFPLIPEYADLRRQAEANAKRYKFSALFPGAQLNAEGKTVAKQGSLNAKDPKEREAALQVEMVRHASMYYDILGRSSILPARERIMEEHPLRVEDFFWVVSNNPLVPPGRELLFAEAFYAGFTGDLPKAVHVLIHQMEHSIRELLKQHGVRVTGLSREGIQMERNLNTLLYDEKLRELLGNDLVFALQSLLVEKFGPDLRNRVAHGLMDYRDFLAPVCHYYWWLCLRVACVPILNALHAQANETGGQEPIESDNSAPPGDGSPT
jgi:hypothetical protein